jgi:O-antigen/teichoic acid export membrane protein
MRLIRKYKDILISISSRGFSAILQLISVLIVTKLTGVSEFGLYSLLIGWSFFIAAVIGGGLSRSMLLSGSVLSNLGKTAIIHADLKKSLFYIACIAVLFQIALLLAAEIISFENYEIFNTTLFIYLIIPVGALVAMIISIGEAMRAIRKPQIAHLIERGSIYGFSMLFIMGYLLLFPEMIDSQGNWIFFMVLVGVFASFLIAWIFKNNILPNACNKPSKFNLKRIFIINLTQVAESAVYRSPILILPFVASVNEIGIFGVCFAIANMAGILYEALSGSFVPKLSYFFERNQWSQLLSLLKKSQAIFFFLTLIPFVLIVTNGHELLGLISPELVSGYNILVLLFLGQLVHMIFGPSHYLLQICNLNMSALVASCSAIIFFIVFMTFFSNYSIESVAIAYSISLLVKSSFGWILATRNIKNRISENLREI